MAVSVPNTFTNGVGNTIDADEVNENFTTPTEIANANIATAAAIDLSKINGGLSFFKAVNIATEQSRTNTAYGTLTTPDQITDVVVPTDGLIVVGYQALWKESVDAAAKAAIFIGSNQLKIAYPQTNQTQAAHLEWAAADKYGLLTTSPSGLVGVHGISLSAYPAPETTGQLLGASGDPAVIIAYSEIGTARTSVTVGSGRAEIFAAASTYTISVQFKASSGSVTAKERKMWCAVLSPQT